jgi:DNA-directed RNA polymerase specialized sigma subunit
MGHIKRDIHKKAREYAEQYDLKQEDTILAFLESKNDLKDKKGRGDIDALIILIDYEDAIIKAKLSGREKETLKHLYDFEYTEREAAELMGVSRKALRSYKDRAIKKIMVYSQFIEEEI